MKTLFSFFLLTLCLTGFNQEFKFHDLIGFDTSKELILVRAFPNTAPDGQQIYNFNENYRTDSLPLDINILHRFEKDFPLSYKALKKQLTRNLNYTDEQIYKDVTWFSNEIFENENEVTVCVFRQSKSFKSGGEKYYVSLGTLVNQRLLNIDILGPISEKEEIEKLFEEIINSISLLKLD